jgi:hypothetical protein
LRAHESARTVIYSAPEHLLILLKKSCILDSVSRPLCKNYLQGLKCDGVNRGVITQPFWHVRSPRGVLEGAFGNSATTGGLLPGCNYDLPLESQNISIFGVKRAKEAKIFRFRRKKNKTSKKSCPTRKKHSMIPLGAFRVQKRRLDCDTSHESEQRRERW